MKKLLALLLVCVLVFSLTGCDKLDYGKAVDLFNRGKYDAAIDAFYELGDYEDSKALFTLSHYWAAIQRMEAGKYSEALPRFLKLGDYEDSAQRATECRYQIAVAEFEAGNFHDARNDFEDVAGYKQANEYLRQINWQAMYDAIAAHPIEVEQNGKTFSIYPVHDGETTPKLVFSVERSENKAQQYSDFLTITLTRDRLSADFICGNDFAMNFLDGTIGSSQSGFGQININICTPDTPLVLETFEKTVADNLGQTTTYTDPADNLMGEMMAENMYDLMSALPQLLQDAGIEITLPDIGFSALA